MKLQERIEEKIEQIQNERLQSLLRLYKSTKRPAYLMILLKDFGLTEEEVLDFVSGRAVKSEFEKKEAIIKY